MEKVELYKNVLDLKYNSELQKANAFLALLTTGVLGLIGNFILLKGIYFIVGVMIALFIVSLGLLAYFRVSKRMEKILSEIKSLV